MLTPFQISPAVLSSLGLIWITQESHCHGVVSIGAPLVIKWTEHWDRSRKWRDQYLNPRLHFPQQILLTLLQIAPALIIRDCVFLKLKVLSPFTILTSCCAFVSPSTLQSSYSVPPCQICIAPDIIDTNHKSSDDINLAVNIAHHPLAHLVKIAWLFVSTDIIDTNIAQLL